MRVALLHPGEMGAAIGRLLLDAGHEVGWASDGRSQSTAARACDFADTGTVGALVARSDLVLSICPPDAARDVAALAGAEFDGIYVDANAVAPATARDIEAIVSAAGSFVDGGIIGGPPTRAGTTRLYLSGARAGEVASLFDGTALEAIPLPGPPGAASAVKACFAAYTKGSTALLLAIRALASAEAVDDALLAEWARSQPGLGERSDGGSRLAARKAWRFAGEMEEIADALAEAGVPDGFHRGAAEIYRRLEQFKDAPEPPTLAELIAALQT